MKPACRRCTSRGSASGKLVSPVRSTVGAAAVNASRAFTANWACSAARSFPRPVRFPPSATTRKVIFRWSGSLLQSHAAVGTRSPVNCRSSRASPSVSNPVPGVSAPSTARAVSGTGTKLRRTALGSDRISAVTSSSRRPGICQSKPVGVNCPSSGSGMCTVTPSAAVPGSNW